MKCYLENIIGEIQASVKHIVFYDGAGCDMTITFPIKPVPPVMKTDLPA